MSKIAHGFFYLTFQDSFSFFYKNKPSSTKKIGWMAGKKEQMKMEKVKNATWHILQYNDERGRNDKGKSVCKAEIAII